MGLITFTTIVKRADALAVGDKISGHSKFEGDRVDWKVVHVKETQDPVLGTVIQINLNVRTPDDKFLSESHEIFLRPADRVHILA